MHRIIEQTAALCGMEKTLSQLESESRKQVQARTYRVRRNLIEAPLMEFDLDITPR